jgi:hypothetical protein
MGGGELDAERRELDERVLALLNAGRKDEYLAMMEALVRESGEDPWVRLHYGTALSLIKPEQAPVQLRAAVALAPDDPVILTHAARRMFELGEFEDSQQYMSRAGGWSSLTGLCSVQTSCISLADSRHTRVIRSEREPF